MKCQSHRGALLDVALGAPAPPGLDGHLASCPECRHGLERERAYVSRMDLELRSALEVEPSPALLSRARRRAAEKEPSPAQPWLRWLVPAGVGLAALTGAILVDRSSTLPPGPPSAAVVSPIPAPPREPPTPRVTAAQPAPGRRAVAGLPTRSTRSRQPTPREAEVLVSAEERAVFQRFVRDMQQRQVDRISLQAAALEREEIKEMTIAAVEVKPLAIEPMTRSDR
jgi:hypothetical protein